MVAAVSAVAPVELVNGGGTGSLHTTAREAAVTEVTAGSGFYAPTLFDRYSAFTPDAGRDVRAAGGAPPGPDTVARCWAAATSPRARPGADRLPEPYLPPGLKLDSLRGRRRGADAR